MIPECASVSILGWRDQYSLTGKVRGGKNVSDIVTPLVSDTEVENTRSTKPGSCCWHGAEQSLSRS